MQYGDLEISVWFLAIVGLAGLLIGVFSCHAAGCFVHGEPMVAGRSKCLVCGRERVKLDSMPPFDRFTIRRFCQFCKRTLDVRPLASGLICAALFISIVIVYGVTFEALELMALTILLLFSSLTDVDACIIPNGCVALAIAIRVAYLAEELSLGSKSFETAAYYVMSALAVAIVLMLYVQMANKVFGRESLGGGDVKLYIVAGLYFSWSQTVLLVFVSCVVGMLMAILGTAQLSSPNEEGGGLSSLMKKTIPFGPAIALAYVVAILLGDASVYW